MFDGVGLFGLLLLLFASRREGGSGGGSAPQLPAPAPATGVQTSTSAPPWPQAPAGLPVFPGPGWQYDEPPPRAVVQRAGQLVQQLWALGKGTYKIEQTEGRWIAYRAEIVRSGKKGVVAYRVATQRLPAGTATSAPAPAPAPAQRMLLPTLRRGDGVKPQQPNSNVALMQTKLNDVIKSGLSVDGRFGGGSETALKAFQQRFGLVPDGVCGPKTWTALLTVRA